MLLYEYVLFSMVALFLLGPPAACCVVCWFIHFEWRWAPLMTCSIRAGRLAGSPVDGKGHSPACTRTVLIFLRTRSLLVLAHNL